MNTMSDTKRVASRIRHKATNHATKNALKRRSSNI